MAENLQAYRRQQQRDEHVQLACRAESLARMDTLGLCDCFIVIHKPASAASAVLYAAAGISATGPADWVPVVRSEIVRNSLNPKFPPLTFAAQDVLTNDQPEDAEGNPVRIVAFDWVRLTPHANCTVRPLHASWLTPVPVYGWLRSACVICMIRIKTAMRSTWVSACCLTLSFVAARRRGWS